MPQLLLFHDKIPNRIQILQTIQLFLQLPLTAINRKRPEKYVA
ncbi:hypothetical protein SFCCH060_1478 [Shigella flexneri CCH060]|uniref:Uncharacterized protein n=1 Tax=Shigella flexneri CCH060 TaxID=754091 RepID=A0A6N3RAM4_SHIFL|nr:hypothetical protein SFCCH060_1478 [Shigella flexneri CCH060]